MIDVPNPTAGRVSAFTLYGLNAELETKPDIGAPGGFVRSTIPLEMGGYGTNSGTSMASPHVTGAVALLLEAKPGTAPSMVRTILQNSADPGPFQPGLVDLVHRQGAGMLDIDDAILADTLVTPGKLSLGEGTGGTRQLSITNNSNQSLTYTLSHQRALSTFGSTFVSSLTTAGASAAFTRGGVAVTTVAVAPHATEVVDVAISTPTLVNGLVYGGYLQIAGGGRTYRVPYTGFWGDYQLIQVLAPGGCSFPGIFKLGGQTTCGAAVLPGATKQLDGTVYNVDQRPDRPVVLFHLAHQSRKLEIRAVNELTGSRIPSTRTSSFRAIRPTPSRRAASSLTSGMVSASSPTRREGQTSGGAGWPLPAAAHSDEGSGRSSESGARRDLDFGGAEHRAVAIPRPFVRLVIRHAELTRICEDRRNLSANHRESGLGSDAS